jgi:chemotaxis protein MotD
MVDVVSARGSSVVSVTSEVLANASFQNAQARSAKTDSDQPSGNDRFAALVDSNTAASSNNDNRADGTAAPRRGDDQPAPDNRARDNSAAAEKTASDKATADKARNASNDRDAKASNDARADANADARADRADANVKADGSRAVKSKSDTPKSDKAASDEPKQASSGDKDTGNQTDMAQDGTAVVAADAVGIAIPVATTSAATVPTTPVTDTAAAPLAIAAAAIAASASLANDNAPVTASPAGAAQADSAKTTAQDAAAEALTAQTAVADTTTAGIATAASVVAATPAFAKAAAQVKAVATEKEGVSNAGKQDATADDTAGTATATPDTDTVASATAPTAETAAKPKSEIGMADAVKADASGNSIAPPAAHGSHHPANLDAGQSLLTPSGNGMQGTGAIPTQHSAASAAATSAAQLTATAATSAPVPLSGVAMEIAASANSGKTRFEIRLDPAELGRIDVRIDIDRHGQVTSHLTVERPETLQMLRQDANQLQRALDNAGLSTGNSGLQFSLRDQSSQGQNDGNQSHPNAHRLVISEEDSVPAVVAGRSYGRMLGSSGGVDIRI